MAYRTKGNPVGKPPIKVDWELVETLARRHCSGAEIASYIGIHHDTLGLKVLAKYGENMTNFLAKMRSKGKATIKAKQFEKAEAGDNMMLIWVGKNFIEQADSQHVKSDEKLQITLVDYKTTQEKIELKLLEQANGQADEKDRKGLEDRSEGYEEPREDGQEEG